MPVIKGRLRALAASRNRPLLFIASSDRESCYFDKTRAIFPSSSGRSLTAFQSRTNGLSRAVPTSNDSISGQLSRKARVIAGRSSAEKTGFEGESLWWTCCVRGFCRTDPIPGNETDAVEPGTCRNTRRPRDKRRRAVIPLARARGWLLSRNSG